VVLDLAGFLGPLQYQDIVEKDSFISELENQGPQYKFRKKMDYDLEHSKLN